MIVELFCLSQRPIAPQTYTRTEVLYQVPPRVYEQLPAEHAVHDVVTWRPLQRVMLLDAVFDKGEPFILHIFPEVTAVLFILYFFFPLPDDFGCFEAAAVQRVENVFEEVGAAEIRASVLLASILGQVGKAFNVVELSEERGDEELWAEERDEVTEQEIGDTGEATDQGDLGHEVDYVAFHC